MPSLRDVPHFLLEKVSCISATPPPFRSLRPHVGKSRLRVLHLRRSLEGPTSRSVNSQPTGQAMSESFLSRCCSSCVAFCIRRPVTYLASNSL